MQEKTDKRNQRPMGKVPFRGVREHWSGRFESRIMIEGKRKYLGTFKTAEEAARVYRDAQPKSEKIEETEEN